MSKEARRFLRAAAHRYAEAQFLLKEGGFTTASVYLAGYAVECALKALILCSEPTKANARTVEGFRGEKAHRFDWLKEQLTKRGVVVPLDQGKQLASVNWWTTTLRYDPIVLKRREAEHFLYTVEDVLAWVKGKV